LFYLLLIGALAVFGQPGLPDPAFERIPFEEWLKGSDEARIRCAMRIFTPRLTTHQRMAATVVLEIDGSEFVKRAQSARMVVFLDIRDRDNHVYRTHRPLLADALKNPNALASINFEQYTFFTPGDFQVAAAVYDVDSKEHTVKRMKLHVPEVPHDPLSSAWRNLPSVEFAGLGDSPDRWFLPEISSRLDLRVKNERPVRIEVLVNESPTEVAMGRTGRVSTRNMGNLIPALKVISQMEIKNGSINVTLLDLERRKVAFAQEQVRNLDWTQLRAALVDNNPNTIDVHALENHEQNAQFFVSEIRKRLESTEQNGDVPLGLSAEPARVLIVLSGPMAFSRGQDLRPIEAAPEPGTKVFYIRYYPPPSPPFSVGFPGPGGRGRGPVPPINVGRSAAYQDSLVGTLKPLAPRRFDVNSPIEFRAALAAIMKEVSDLK
jgi:hypothetical protein